MRPLTWWGGLATGVAVALYTSALAYEGALPEFVQNTWQLDKVLHFAIAGVICFFLDGALARRSLRAGGVSVPLSSVIFLVPAGVEEYLQRFVVYRTSSLGDFAADAAGAVLAIWLSRRVAR